MATIVCVHGIAQEQMTADTLEARWLPGLAGGIRTAGYNEIADRVWRAETRDKAVDVRMAAYGDLFLPPDMMGEDEELTDLPAEQQELAASLAAEWLARAATRPKHPDQQTARTELAYLEPGHEEQGLRAEAGRAALNGLARLRWFAPSGMAFASRFVNRALRQVTSYLSDPDLHEAVQQRVLAHVDDQTRVIIGHSLGSVVAYEVAANRLSTPLPLLVTAGSPLGLKTIIYDRIQPQPPTYPSLVSRWVNVSDRNDLVAAELDLAPLFERKPPGAAFENSWTPDNGAQPHSAEFYLSKRVIGEPIGKALTS